MFCFSYSAKYVKEYIEGAKPIFSVGEYWDSCNYNGYGLDYNQGNALNLFFISEIICKRNLTSFSAINLYIFIIWLVKYDFRWHLACLCYYIIFTTSTADSHRQRVINWIDATGQLSTAFDFTTKGILQVWSKTYTTIYQEKGMAFWSNVAPYSLDVDYATVFKKKNFSSIFI